jgi:hypothetical protein
MRKSIPRTITATRIESATVEFKDGKPLALVNAPITVTGSVKEDKAFKLVQKQYGLKAQVTAVTEIEDTYEISVEDFMKYAKKVETPAEE